MGNLSLYLATVLIWGSSFYAIRLQLGVVEPAASIMFRFSLAALVLFAFILIRGKSLRYPLKTHSRFAVLGFFLFFLNFLLIYFASYHLPTGLVSVIFSSVVIFNMVNGAIFLKDRLSAKMIIGACIGITGIALIFFPEISDIDSGRAGLTGLAFALVGTLSASTGMLISAKHQRDALPVLQTNAWGMFYGALIMATFILVTQTPVRFDPSITYISSLFYLAIVASVLAFSCFLTLVGRIGAGKAAYATVLFPILSLALSTLFEDYQWSAMAVLGVALAIGGNVLILTDKDSS